jgi:hypothetical protein
MLAYIKEQLTAFDVCGIELDFMREPKCVRFYDDPNAHKHLNEFMTEVKRIADGCAKLHGHPVRIAVRLPRDLELCRMLGFAVLDWAREGLFDVAIPSSHWDGVDTGMPIAEWTARLTPYNVDVFACMEMNLPHKLYTDTEVAKAHTAQYHPQGSKQTYVYNLYHPYLDYINDLGMWAIPAPSAEALAELWSTCGDIAQCLHGVRRHILTQESPDYSYLKPRWHPLPAIMGDGVEFEVQTGVVAPDAQLTLFLGVRGEKDLRVRLNGVPCAPLADNRNAHVLKNKEIDPDTVLAFRVPANACRELVQRVLVQGDAQSEIYYVELMVDAK